MRIGNILREKEDLDIIFLCTENIEAHISFRGKGRVREKQEKVEPKKITINRKRGQVYPQQET